MAERRRAGCTAVVCVCEQPVKTHGIPPILDTPIRDLMTFPEGCARTVWHVMGPGRRKLAALVDLTPAEALRLLLDQVDYTAGACAPTELVGAVLDKSVIETCKRALARESR